MSGRLGFLKLFLLCGAVIAVPCLLNTPANAQGGEAVHKAKCASCHGADGAGANARRKGHQSSGFLL